MVSDSNGDADPVAAAKAAGLRYSRDDRPGIRRERRSGTFAYVAPGGARITEEAALARIRKLAIPPAYEDVWICPVANGHLQATGRDARGRKQYRYHTKWREVRDESKFERMLAFAGALPRIRSAVDRDLSLPGLPRAKVLAAIVALLESTLIRVGNEEYARDNGSFGLTTLQNRHVSVKVATLRFRFRGKSGKNHDIDLIDRRLARVVANVRDLPGQEVFQYLRDDGERESIGSEDVNDYLQELAGEAFTAKDFRTWTGTVVCAVGLAAAGAGGTIAERKRVINATIGDVANRLGNTPAVCRKSYIHPEVLATYLDAGALELATARANRAAGLRGEERAVLAFLAARAQAGDATARNLAASLERKGESAARRPAARNVRKRAG